MDGENCGLIDLELVRELCVAASTPHSPGTHKQIVFVPEGFVQKEIPALSEIPLPDHIRQKLVLVDRESFTRYVKLYKGSTSQIFGTITQSGAKFVGVLDYHESGLEHKPNRALHVVDFNPQFSDEFAAWLAINHKGLTQDQFLEHLRRWGDVITGLSDADMIEMISNLEFATTGTFSSKVERVTGGKKLTFNEEIEGTTSSGKQQGETRAIPVPDTLKMNSEIFLGGAKFDYEADLLYRIGGGRLTISIELKRPHKVIKTAIDALMSDIESETEIKPLIGTVTLPTA